MSKKELGDCLALSFSETAGISAVVSVGVCESSEGCGVFICTELG